ncbi:uncharacterized protein N0V89_003769 [Didymosphaeria variabile]|uniref:AMP-activated protein kinase glycogen-binding domain-containing protein n=1 Tax=Didymosphaeria variabile TaxID=1932322 RepID=A0A9W9CBU0_9PLEO|nr:uncharacterized protein N0V89_003769 [Didymosphaeria variabile]KAJ4355749.1 hypothetical protein N0V89_003769 [Didymosphaeria variabile]
MAAGGTDPAGRQIYTCQLDHVPEKPYQYKVWVDDKWVLDDNMPIAQDQSGNVNNVGYAEHVSQEPVTDPARGHNDLQRAENQNILSPPVNLSPRQSGHAQTGITSTTREARAGRERCEERQHHVEPGTDAEQQAPLLRHESFQDESKRARNEDNLRRGLRPQSPPMSTIEEEPATSSDNGGSDSQPETPSTIEQAREYQRALIEAMPTSIADGFTRASVLLPVRTPNEASDFANAPLMRHETINGPTNMGGEHRSDEQDELSQAPLMRHETGLEHVDGIQSHDTDELEQAPLMRISSSADDGPGEFDQAPLMGHERTAVSPGNESSDEFDQGPLMRFETNLEYDAAPAETPGPRLSYGTTLVDEDDDDTVDGADDEFGNVPLMRFETGPGRFHGSEPSTRSSTYSERMMFPMDNSNPPTLATPNRSSSVYSNDRNELDRAPTLPHEASGWISDESYFDHWIDPRADPDYNQGVTYYQVEDSSDEDGVGELDRAPTMSHEAADDHSSSSSELDELDTSPTLPHEVGNSSESNVLTGSDGACSEWRPTVITNMDTRHITGAGDALGSTDRTNSFSSERLREAFKTRIFGSTRRPMLSRDAFGENDIDFGGAPLLPHERTDLLPDGPNCDDPSSKGGGRRQRTDDIPGFPPFARRATSSIFRSERSNLPHRMPRSDEDDLDLRDTSLEIFPMDREEVISRVRDIGNRLPEDLVPSPIGEVSSPAIVSHSGSSVNLAPIRTSSTMSLRSIREDASEDGDQQIQLASPVLMLASRVPKLPSPSSPILIPKGEDLLTPMPRDPRAEYSENGGRTAIPRRDAHATAPAGRRRDSIKKDTGVMHDGDDGIDDTISKRYGKVFSTVALPPEPPKPSAISFLQPEETNEHADARERFPTPYPQEDSSDDKGNKGSNIAQKICAHFRACFPSRNAR